MTNHPSTPHDPDFNPSSTSANSSGKSSFFSQLSSKNALIAGVVGGMLLLCTVGFFVLLGVVLKSKGA